MKRIPSALLTPVAAAALAAALVVLPIMSKHDVTAVHAHSGCTDATLTGNYGTIFSGFQIQHNKSVPFDGAGLSTFDGAGNLSATFAFSLNGTGTTDNPYSATYTVNPDCTVSVTATPGSGGDNFAEVIIGDGREVLATDISAPDTLSLDIKRQ